MIILGKELGRYLNRFSIYINDKIYIQVQHHIFSLVTNKFNQETRIVWQRKGLLKSMLSRKSSLLLETKVLHLGFPGFDEIRVLSFVSSDYPSSESMQRPRL